MHVKLIIEGRVQGVGYRDWAIRQATGLELTGWVKNRHAGTVEAVLNGEDSLVSQMVKACYQGPALAQVTLITVEHMSGEGEYKGFNRLPTD